MTSTAPSTAQPKLWYREFVRSTAPDIDHEATQEFMTSTFTDIFGQSLFTADAQGKYVGNLMSGDQLVNHYYINTSEYKVQSFAVADGISVTYNDAISPWFDSHLRLAHFVTSVAGSWNTASLRILIVGSPDVLSTGEFLQVASWDSTIQEFRFYGRESINESETQSGWVYMGRSSEAFSKEKSYLGPFNGHVNGTPIMKELHQPWVHWQGSPVGIVNCLSPAEKKNLLNYPYLSTENVPLGKVLPANILEQIVRDAVRMCFTRRIQNDFLSADMTPNPNPPNIQRWMAHLLLTTTINIAAAENSTEGSGHEAFLAPQNLFLDVDTFSRLKLLPPMSFPLSFTEARYKSVVQKLNLATIQEVFPDQHGNLPPGYIELPVGTIGGGKETAEYETTTFMQVIEGEGAVPLITLQASFEDFTGASFLFNPQPPLPRLLSEAAVQALVTVDFPNPVYSWRRGVLMYYVPETTTWDGETKKYDLEFAFVKNIQQSQYASQAGSPEAEFLDLYHQFTTDNTTPNKIKKRVQNYLHTVQQNLRKEIDDNNKIDYVESYVRLAESNRRLYRPLPLDEFGLTLPYALGIPPEEPWIEMMESGETKSMDPRGVEFLQKWRSTLWGDDPIIIPTGGTRTTDNVLGGAQDLTRHGLDLPAIAGLHVDCSGAPRVHRRLREDIKSRRRGGCPFAHKRWVAPEAVIARHLKTGK